jgi:hypothetical protein
MQYNGNNRGIEIVILANAGIQAIGESDDGDEDSRQALVSSECGAPFFW